MREDGLLAADFPENANAPLPKVERHVWCFESLRESG